MARGNQEVGVAEATIDIRSIGAENDALGSSGQGINGETKQFVSFTIGEEEYGIDIIFVREIKGWVHVTPLPNSPNYMLGVLNLRGTIVPIFDMRCRFGMGDTDVTPKHVMVIVAVGKRIMGVLVDTVSDIITITADEILKVPELDQRGDRKFLTGLITQGEKMIALLSLEELFDLEGLVEQLST